MAATVVIGGGWALGSLRSASVDSRLFLDTARSLATSQAQRAAEFEDLLFSRDLEREVFVATIDQTINSLEDGLAEIGALDIPPEAVGAADLLTEALATWQGSLVEFRRILLAIADNPGNPLLRLDLADAIFEMEVGDRVYVAFLARAMVLAQQVDPPIAFASVGYVPSTALSESALDALVFRVENATGMTVTRSVSVGAYSFDPSFTGGERGGLPVLPNSETVAIEVQVSNDGNEPELDVEIVISVFDRNGRIRETLIDVIALIGPGESSAIRFDDVPVEPGKNQITIGVTGTGTGPTPVEFFVSEATP